MLSHIRFVLVNTSHPGNIGAAARAMKTMGLSELVLVAPEQYPHMAATARAAGADDILEKATIVESLPAALAGCEYVFGTSARARHLDIPTRTPRECALEITHLANHTVAIVFGRERNGLTNEELALCHRHIVIPANTDYASLNLAAAVQIIAYEIYFATLVQKGMLLSVEKSRQLVDVEQLEGFYAHLQQVLIRLKVLNPKQPKMLMRRLKRLFNRAELDETEINILRGILSAITKKIDK